MIEIISKNNNCIKDLIKIRDDKKFRKDKSLFYVEGKRIISNISPKLINNLFILKDKINEYKNIISNINTDNIYLVSNDVFDKIKDTVNSQGIIATIKFSSQYDINYSKNKKILLLDNINDPGNLGTIIRTCEASDIDLIILTSNCCDIYNPKVIRASMSSITRMNIIIVNDVEKIINEFKKNNFHIYSSSLNENSVNLYDVKFKDKFIIIIGSEANGIRQELLNISNSYIKIPMKGEIESLNVSVATSIIVYETYRQKYESR